MNHYAKQASKLHAKRITRRRMYMRCLSTCVDIDMARLIVQYALHSPYNEMIYAGGRFPSAILISVIEFDWVKLIHNCCHTYPHVRDRKVMRFNLWPGSAQRWFDDDIIPPPEFEVSVCSVKIHCPQCGRTRRYGFDPYKIILDGVVHIPLDFSNSVIHVF